MRFLNPFYILICVILLYPDLLFSQFYPAQTYSTTNGMPSNSVFSITQAENRMMWFITSKGVATYDASEWYLFPESLNLPFTEHSYIQKGTDGKIWVAGYNKSEFTLQYHENGNWVKVVVPEEWTEQRTPFSFKTIGKKVFLGLENRLFMLNESNSKWEVRKLENGSKKAEINSLVGIDGALFISTREGIYELDGDSIIRSPLNKYPLQSNNILSINKHNNAFYILGLNWIGKVDENEYKLVSNDLGIFTESGFKKYSLEIDNTGRVYYSSFSPASVLNEKTGRWIPLKVLGRQQNVLSNQIFVDAESNYWVGDNRGLFKFNLLRFQNFNSNTDLIEDEVSSIYESSNGRIILANPRGLNFYDKGEITSIDLRNRYPNFLTRILDVEETKDGRVFLALSGGGLVSMNNGTVRSYDSGILNNAVITLATFKGDLLVANYNSIYRFKDGRLSLFGEYNGIRNIIALGSDKLAILSFQGVYITDGVTTQKYISNQNSLNSTFDIEEWKNEYLVATENGLGILKAGEIVEYDAFALRGTSAYSILKDSNNNLWVGTNDGIFKFDGKEVNHFNKRNGLIGNEVNRNALIEDSNGNIWIGTDSGVSLFEQTEEVESQHVPVIELKKFSTLAGTDLTKRNEKSIEYNENSIELKFRTISFFNEQEMSFQYKLSGFEENWNEASDISTSFIRYTNLDPGQYQFLVKGRVEFGAWSEPYSLNFEIQKPFYQTAWFIILIIVLLIAVAYSIYRIRVLFLIKQRETLRKLVTRRTEEIDMQNRSLKEAYRDLEQAHIKLVQTEKMAALGVLTAGVAHEINNPLNYIKAGSEIVKQLTEEKGSSVVIEDKDTFKTVLSGIDLGVQKILNITRSLGSFSSTSDKINNTIHINKVLDDTLIILEHELRGRIKVIKEYDSQSVYVVGNEGKLYQVFSNLVVNSIHAIEGDGTITISTVESNDEVIVSISDTGSGISEEVRKKIFDPFFTTKEQGKGTGLGLSIVYNIVKELNGDIEIESTVDKGTTVKLKLKRASEKE
ncbi:MAG: hypothetical protein CL662_03335 [Bacteroidetes bacterium]|nr:hypothetical protein [Bacteroidota bacterium]